MCLQKMMFLMLCCALQLVRATTINADLSLLEIKTWNSSHQTLGKLYTVSKESFRVYLGIADECTQLELQQLSHRSGSESSCAKMPTPSWQLPLPLPMPVPLPMEVPLRQGRQRLSYTTNTCATPIIESSSIFWTTPFISMVPA